MQRRLVSGVVLSAAVAVFGSGCEKVNTTTTTSPSPTAVTETFSGTLTLNGGLTFPFPVNQAGTINGTLTGLGDDAAVIGMAIGTYAGTTCQIVLANDNAGKSSIITGVVNASGLLCARVYDATGKLAAPVTFSVDVSHF